MLSKCPIYKAAGRRVTHTRISGELTNRCYHRRNHRTRAKNRLAWFETECAVKPCDTVVKASEARQSGSLDTLEHKEQPLSEWKGSFGDIQYMVGLNCWQ